jgi:hypothetical protein
MHLMHFSVLEASSCYFYSFPIKLADYRGNPTAVSEGGVGKITSVT